MELRCGRTATRLRGRKRCGRKRGAREKGEWAIENGECSADLMNEAYGYRARKIRVEERETVGS